MPSRNQYKHPYLQNLPEVELQALSERCRDWGLHPTEFAKLVSNWFKNFREEADHPLALKLLHAIEYYSEAAFNELLADRKAEVLRYLLDNNLDPKRIWFAVPSDLADSAVRHAHPLSKVWALSNARFVSFEQIGAMLGGTLGAQDTLVLFNDTHGSGKQFMREVWPQVQPLVGKVGAVLIVGAAIAAEALALFRQKAHGVQILPGHATASVRQMKGFTSADVSRLVELGGRVYPGHPQGFGQCGLLLAYHFQCPNNSLPLIWADGKNNVQGEREYPWNALFAYRGKIKIRPASGAVQPVLPVTPVAPAPAVSPVSPAAPAAPTLQTPGKPAWASAVGVDEFKTQWAEINVGGVVQRFRFIPAGKFMMGSLPGEEGRDDERENPYHRVTISQGFWLADAACTQALWLEVMGESPSHFSIHRGGGPEHPVESVNWHQVQEFIKALNMEVPGCQITLPTEAEWEYACRAGKETPFSFGMNINTNQVNYNGNYPYANAKKGQYRECTVPVKALPANAWGLYQMHGNVWEWCADKPRVYAALPSKAGVIDPGLEQALDLAMSNDGAARVLRGGGWIDCARDVRSACRSHLQPGRQFGITGFRLALRFQTQASTPEA